MTPAQAILSGCVDYAGMFPPASLDLDATVQNYASYRAGRDAWALGSLVLPVESLHEFTERWPEHARTWRVSAVSRRELSAESIRSFARQLPACVAAVEFSPVPTELFHQLAAETRAGTAVYVEVSPAANLVTKIDQTFAILASQGVRAKLRAGGTTAEATPSVHYIAQFIAACVRHRVRFKATAGLHHAVCGEHPCTHAPGAERARMHGFLNVLLAATLLANGGDVLTATALLQEGSLDAFQFTPSAVHWHGRSFSTQQLSVMRRDVMASFGSCSFDEPLGEMRAGGLIA